MVMKPVLVVLSALTVLSAAQKEQTFTGLITDEMCPTGSHAHMKMGATDADCTRACIAAHGSRYVLYDGKRAYVLSDQEAPEALAAQKVRVTGTLDEKTMTIRVASIAAADSP
jgi:hypothetical protein